MAFDGVVTGPNPVTFGITAFRYVTGIEDDSRIESANVAAARAAGYTGTRNELIQIGGGLRNAETFAAGQGFGPGSGDRDIRVARPVVSVAPPIPLPGAAAPGPIPVPVPAPQPGLPTGGDILDDLLRRPVGSGGSILDDLLRQPRQPAPTGWPPAPGTDIGDLLRRPRVPLPDVPARLPQTARVVLTNPIVATILGVLWPSTIKPDPPWQPPPPKVPTGSSGPKNRGRVRRPLRDRLPRPVPVRPPAPSAPAVDAVPRTPPYLPEIRPDIGPISLPAPAPIPGQASPMPAPAPRPALPSLPSLLPLLVPFFGGNTMRPALQGVQLPRPIAFPNPIGLTAVRPGGVALPLTSPFGEPPRDNCSCSSSKRKPRKKSCTNPIVSKRKRTQDGRTLLTITRELKCPA